MIQWREVDCFLLLIANSKYPVQHVYLLYLQMKCFRCTETGGGCSQCNRRGTQTSADPERAAGSLPGGNGERKNGTFFLCLPDWFFYGFEVMHLEMLIWPIAFITLAPRSLVWLLQEVCCSICSAFYYYNWKCGSTKFAHSYTHIKIKK